jgi:hypothetical protein
MFAYLVVRCLLARKRKMREDEEERRVEGLRRGREGGIRLWDSCGR